MAETSSGLRSVPVAPDAVRVFRGFKRDDLPQETFFAKLGSIFIPGTVQIQKEVGLTAYMPSVMPRDHHPKTPDEIALVFYEVQQSYHDAKRTVAGRAYSDLHQLVFDMEKSFSGWPRLYRGSVEADEKYHLFTEAVDWQLGTVNAFVGVRSDEDEAAFLGAVADFLTQVQGDGGPDGAIAVASTEHVVYWEHWPEGPVESPIPELASRVETAYDREIPPFELDLGVWEPYDGVEVKGEGETFNFRFRRL